MDFFNPTTIQRSYAAAQTNESLAFIAAGTSINQLYCVAGHTGHSQRVSYRLASGVLRTWGLDSECGGSQYLVGVFWAGQG